MSHRALDFPILVVDAQLHSDALSGRVMRMLMAELEKDGFRVDSAGDFQEAATMVGAFNGYSCVVVSVEDGEDQDLKFGEHLYALLLACHAKDRRLPVYLAGERKVVSAAQALKYLQQVRGLIYLYEDTMEFLAKQVARAARTYLDHLLPPLFKSLVKYADDSAYSWHTPGHAGGVAFLKSPVGRAFHQFYGENTFRTDLSISVPEVGSLLDHSGPVGEAEKNTARIFGADHNFFVTNGTSTANKIVWHGMVGRDDVVVVDRNCHKSIMHVILMTGALPVYFVPSRNGYGIIGPIGLDQFTPKAIAEKIAANPLTRGRGKRGRLAVVTNSTYDGICYNADSIKEKIGSAVDALHFDEAWFGYAPFHEFYKGHHGIGPGAAPSKHPLVFATTSTHKLLAAFSQGSYVNVKNSPTQKLDFQRFNEAFMMHSSTSPHYPMMASLDVASAMMDGPAGRVLVQETIEEARAFRRAMRGLGKALKAGDWWFSPWQPEAAPLHGPPNPKDWDLVPGAKWHGFGGLSPRHALLDPIKVTVLCPGLAAGEKAGIPAAVVSKFLWERGLTVEKTGLYSFLILFSMGVTKGKWSTMVTELLEFKRLYDGNVPLEASLPSAASAYPGKGLRDLCQDLHETFRAHKTARANQAMYTVLPEPALRPADAYHALVHGGTEHVPLEKAMGRVSAVMIVPYPPGIPVVMPGERFTPATRSILQYLEWAQDFDDRFPGFENDIHGVRIVTEKRGRRYLLECVKE